ncbi:MAG TPA: homoserine O-succinyltransferase [Steroidobacteraceae bacterium]|nr:homoserine O-succinyltransferase [Steroidobacteraceae bacterium]
MTDITIGLINNMPDSAFEATESQFRGLLEAAVGGPVRLRLTTLPEVPRSADTKAYIAQQYAPLQALMAEPPDALIITGTEPIAPDLRDEPYWSRFAKLVDWSIAESLPSIWSCLAAHGAVLHLSGIQRQRLGEKCCGVFAHKVQARHALMSGLGQSLLTPHSRWNDLPIGSLEDAGYSVLSAREETGANVFLKQQNGAQLVFLQGHPEYESESLLKEYRRDIGRYVRSQQPFYPTLPHEYFTPAALTLLDEFRLRAQAQRAPQVMSTFPLAEIQASLVQTWRTGAVQLYRNWLKSVTAGRRPMSHKAHGVL